MITALIVAPVVGYFAVTDGLQPAQSITDLMEPAKLTLWVL